MNTDTGNTIYTIGHSTRSLEEFTGMLYSFNVALLADIRSYPGSKRYPHFNKEALETSLPAANISYLHMPALGGRRTPRPDSANTAWRNKAFQGYADYMETQEFKTAVEELQLLATTRAVAYMCSEAVWWRCHRALVSDYLKTKGWKVLHIMDVDKATEHPYTAPAREVQGKLFYD
jgi:uncharacterized protein (DUF488 family)